MKLQLLLLGISLSLFAAPPSITELQPRGAQKGRPFELTIVGKDLAEGPTVQSSLPATFTPLANSKPGYVTFLVEPTSEWAVGTYTVRVKAANGLSNILLLSIGAFPEMIEEESRPGSLPNQNDSIERAQSLPASSLTVNGRLRGAERDVYRIPVKAGERRVFEVEARRVGSALDPVLQIFDPSGKRLARSEDDPTLSLDPRLEMTFAKEGVIYVEVSDARFSSQMQDFYRFKTGNYEYPADIFPLGGPRGKTVDVTLSKSIVKADLKTPLSQVTVAAPNTPTLPLPFAVGDYPELREPLTAPIALPVTINGRLDKPAEVDQYELAVTPGQDLFLELQARELGTSKLTGLITVYDESGKRLASAGDGPLPVDVAAVQASSRTLGDPLLMFKVPEGVRKIKVAVEDLAQRGGTHYGYRLTLRSAPYDLKATIITPFVNIPAGGTAIVAVDVERRGYMGPLKVSPLGLPKGITVQGGDLAPELIDPLVRTMNRRATLSLTAEKGLVLPATELGFLVKGENIERKATGFTYLIAVNGANTQGVVDRQRPLNGRHLGNLLPAATTDPTPANLELTLIQTDKKEVGFEYRFRWRWLASGPNQPYPSTVNVDLPNLAGTRIIEIEQDKTDKSTGTFLVTTSKNSLAGPYNIGINGKWPGGIDVFSPLLRLDVPELQPEEPKTNASTSPAR
jgi:hypothetical protein